MNQDDEKAIYKVVVNLEEQYSIWPADREIPPGWESDGKTGLKAECLAHIEEVWTDMRPLSLRKQMDELARNPPQEPEWLDEPIAVPLVERLAQGKHRVVAKLHPEKSSQAFKESIERGYVHLKFPETAGGTELGVTISSGATESMQADFENGTGKVQIEGTLTLDFVKVRCLAEIDLSTFEGLGHLEVLN